MSYPSKLLIVFALGATLSGCGLSEPDVVKRYKYYIGASRWKKINTLTTSGEYDYGGIKFPFTTFSKRPDAYKFVVPFNGKYYAQAFDGTKGWKIDAFKNETHPTLLTGENARMLANEADPELEDPFIHSSEKGFKVAFQSDTTIGSRPAQKIRLIRKNAAVEYYYFDLTKAVLLLKKARSKNPEMNGAILTTSYSDYREVDKIKLPFKIVHESNGQVILKITIDKVLVNEPIDDREFQY